MERTSESEDLVDNRSYLTLEILKQGFVDRMFFIKNYLPLNSSWFSLTEGLLAFSLNILTMRWFLKFREFDFKSSWEHVNIDGISSVHNAHDVIMQIC